MAAKSVDIPAENLDALRQVDGAVTNALAELGMLYLQEKTVRLEFERVSKRLSRAEAQAAEALEQQEQVHSVVLTTMGLEDGSWSLNLEEGKLVSDDEQHQD